MAESKTARASMRAGSMMEKKKDPFDTSKKKIAELRKQREAKLAVVRYDFIDALLEEYDKLLEQNYTLQTAGASVTSYRALGMEKS